MKRAAARELASLRVALEDSGVPEQLLEGEDMLRSYYIELDDDEDEFMPLDNNLCNELENAVSGLECLQETLTKDYLRGASYDSATNAFLKYQVSETYRRFGIEGRATASLEAIDSEADTHFVLKVTLEGIGATLKDIWEGIKRHLLKLLKKFDRVFDRILRAVGELKTRAEELSSASRQYTLGSVSGSSMKVVGASLIQYQGKVDGASVVQGLFNLNNAYHQAYNNVGTVSGVYYGRVTELASHLLHTKTEEEINLRLFESFYELSDSFTFQSEEFAGGYTFEPIPVESRYGRELGYQIVRRSGSSQVYETTIATPTPKEVERVAIEVIRVANSLMWGRTRLRRIQRDQDNCIRAVDQLIKVGDAAFKERMTARALSTRVARLANRALAAPLNRMNVIAFQASRSALVYGETALITIRNAQAAR